MSLSKLGITGSEKDYQLWISSAEKKTSYPLTGHEHPYGIKMSCIPATGLLQQQLEGSTSASALQEAFLEGPQELQDQFILKPRHSARNQARKQQGKVSDKKTVRKSSLKNWAFGCISRTREVNEHPCLPPTKTKQLFGAPLEDVCDNDTLPTPILDMLSFINHKGPFTEGIFRKSGSIKSCRALKKKLNCGDTVNLNDVPIFVISSVLKGSEKDYQLWISSAEKKTSYPLTGHEHPYGIKMSCIPATGLLQQQLEGSTSASALQEAFLEGPQELQDQFILKPRHSARNQARKQQGKVSDKKTVRKSSLKNWAFGCISRTREVNEHPCLPPTKTKQLFGAPLEDVCDNDTLPTPILDMLSFINHKGPFTEGIFRKSGSIKSCRALKKKLNCGDTVNLNDVPIFVISSVLKGSEKDYQLWISSAEKKTSYPLTGHEHPYGIKMSCIPATGLLQQQLEGSTSASALQEAFLEGPQELQDQFILKPRHSARNQARKQQGKVSDKKTVRKSSLKNWAFGCISRTREVNEHPCLPPTKTKQLFGAPLEDVCDNDTLPTPILDMLSFINHKGPFTEGIFRKSGSIKSCRALKKKLNCGDTVNLNDVPIFVISSVLKDFLRNIQGSIFSASLYDKWLDVIDQGNDEDKIKATQRLLDQLPRANVVFLRYLFAVLRNIEQHSSSNQMTAYNLSVCITPSMLCLSNSGSSENFTKQISFIQFLIENCLKIFGEDITCLFGETSVSSDNSNITDITDNSEKVAVSDKKTVRKSSLKNWAFGCISRTRKENQHTSLPPTKPKQLFGAPLEDVCDNDTLPIPILDMLSFINSKGLLTEGIFRKSASIKSCRALKKKLNCGDTVNLNEEPILVIACVLKDFLRNIQGSIFSASLYDKWLDVIDQRNEDDKIKAIQRLLDQLPRANVVFLRYLFAVLRNIEQHSSSNQMTAYNLSVCITPSMLCLSNSGSSENFTKQISFIQFLIENCLKIFGEDITCLFGETSVSSDNSNITDIIDNSEKVAVSDKKTVRKSSLKNWAFGCICRTREENQHPSLPPTKPKQLFGAPLEDVCDNDTLPTPILDMLSFINQKGLFTECIFGKSASIKSCRALKKKLNCGDTVNLNEEPILVIACVLKDFLRNIQGSIFSASLYDKWLDVIDQGNEDDKIKATQRLLDQLPRANVVFLRYLFAVLRNIEQHSSSNQMTAYNLSVCITPSMLCLSNSGSSENFTKQISFIQFLIENCLKIFGEDITCLFGEMSVSSDNSDITDITDNIEKVAVSDKKTVRKSSLKNWAFGCISRTREENQHPCLPPTKPKQLFGAPLEDVCDNDTLPTPILDMLSFVNQKGSSTEGIFRKSASIKSCRALKKKLNCGDTVNLNEEPMLVISSVLKDFLQNIQGSIFSSSPYDKWLDVIDQGNEEDTTTATQRQLVQLPRANVIFPQYHFGLFYNIEQPSSSNQMTAYNLSVCITPSMLCLSNSGSSENFTKQISFIQFLIENCLKIFGEDITCLFGETSVSSDNSDITDITDNSEKVAVSDKKTVRKSSLKNWAFGCISRTCKENQHPSLPPTKPKQLFGAPLEDVCDNDTLPTPILDMLYFINQKGPFTEGIFGKSPSIKSCRALKKKLNCGDTVNLNEEPILVIASVLKDFLRNIQGSIFSASLYDKWLDVIDQGEEEDKIIATQRLLDQLPRANVVFLRYLFAVLYNIEQHSSSNQMTAYNLSVCITPSMLCLSNSGSSENFTKQISFIQFLIENCLKIFGEDITCLFGETSVSSDNSDITDITDNSEKVAVSDKKTVRKSSLKNWAFGCISRTCKENQHPCLPPTKPKQLFGAPLEDVCDNDTLPTPILDMLYFINQKGPFTEGIFRKSPSIKSCRALKKKLNCGDTVNLNEEPILVIASVLKDFLRNIQGSIFSASLYDKWLDVIDQGNEDDKIKATQRLLDQLPRANVVFLRYLFAVLRNIEQHSSSNQMTAYNLSVCITPSILHLPNSGSSELGNFTKKISFIQFLIENCLKIFGEDITCLFGEMSVSSDNSDITDITDNSEKVAVSDKKTVRKSSLKNWAFGCISRNCKENQHPCLPPTKPKQLFGAPLEDVCDNDTLPTPILDMLYFINQKGPFTEGIFRKSPSIKSCRALKKKLNCGDTVNLNEEPILVIASVLKDFLRNIQGSIFSASLYDKWLDVIDQGNEDDKIKATQRLLDQLPRANVVFLRYLFAVLRNIEQHSSSNQMTAYNLSVCITPSILHLPNSGSSELGNFTKKISFIQFLIENCLKIFGEDITCLFGEMSVSSDNSDITDITDNSEKVAVIKEQSLESEPVRMTMFYKKGQLQYDAMTSSRMGPSTDLSTVF
ncbi:uncharacterized protein [Bos indicus]|uniref:Uncharacterized protein isoform X9 n=1 Tax=Bos indicus TaxID=9915 RepID=A0ABM4SGF8_BOSIN